MTRIVPNSYQKPNLYTDKLMRYLTGDEWKTLDYALRRTFGFQRETDRISVSQFMTGNGRLDEHGQPVEFGTGLSREAQIRALNELIRFGILVELAPNNAQKHGRLWTLQLDESKVRFDLILERAEQQQVRGRKRTEKARQAQATSRDGQLARIGLPDRPVASVNLTDQYRSVGQTSIGLPDRPVSVCGTDPQKYRRNTEGNPAETQPGMCVPIVEAWRLLVALCEGDEQAAAAVWRLQERFAAVTQLKRPDPETEHGRAKLLGEWWPHLRQVLAEADNDPDVAETAMQEAFRSMVQRDKPLTVVGPRSIVRMTAGVLAGKRRGEPARTGPLLQRPKGMQGIDAYVERRGLGHGN